MARFMKKDVSNDLQPMSPPEGRLAVLSIPEAT